MGQSSPDSYSDIQYALNMQYAGSRQPSVPQVVSSSQSRDSELHTLEQNELLVTEKEDGYWDSGEKNSPQYKPWENLV